MSHLRVLICRVDDEEHPNQMTGLRGFDLPDVDPGQMEPETALDDKAIAFTSHARSGSPDPGASAGLSNPAGAKRVIGHPKIGLAL